MMRIAIALAGACTFASSLNAMVGGAPLAGEPAGGAVVMLTGSHGTFCSGVALTRAFARTDIVPDMDREIERLERAYAAAIVTAAKAAPAVTPSGLAADPDDDESLVPALEASVEAVQAQKGAA